MLMKKKHCCSNQMIVDLIKLLIALKVPHVPTSWYKLQSTIERIDNQYDTDKKLIDSRLFFCPNCEQQTNDSKRCTNGNCSYQEHSPVTPHTLLVMNIQRQIECVLKSTKPGDLTFSKNDLGSTDPIVMADINDGRVYQDVIRSLHREYHKNFISLSCNIDGVAIFTSSEQTMWTFVGCINELPRSIRFDIENIIGIQLHLVYLVDHGLICSFRDQCRQKETIKNHHAANVETNCSKFERITKTSCLPSIE